MERERQPKQLKFEKEPDFAALARDDFARSREAQLELERNPPPPPRRSKLAWVMGFIYAFVFWRAMYNQAFPRRGGALSFIRRFK